MLEAHDALDIARQVAREAVDLLRTASGSSARTWSKSNSRDLVTEWDTRCEAMICERLHRLAPGIPLLGEEGTSGEPKPGGSTEFRWLIDPIDGTVNFAHGLPFFSVVVALEQHGQPIAGVVHAPVLGWEFYAHRQGGAFMNGQPLHVSATATLEQALLATGFPYDRATNPNNNLAEWSHFQQRAGACRRMGSASLDLCMVAHGWFDGYWERRLSPWDVSAGALIVSEAGGRVTSCTGQPFLSAAGELVASNGVIHQQILDELAAVAGPS
jgi:myo-inositol-1(or 4)-monophosphatase